MNVHVIPCAMKLTDKLLSGSTVIVVDVLRATSSIIWAVKNGANKVIPAQDPGEAAAIAVRLGRGCVLAGESNCMPLADFDLGNSPQEFTQDAVRNRTVIMSTTNGTNAIHNVRSAKTVLIGAMINRTAVAKRALALGDDVILQCAGTDGRLSADDLCAAGAILDAMERLSETPLNITDIALVARMVYRDFMDGRERFSAIYHYRRLVEMGYEADVRFCMERDVTDVVPMCVDGVIHGTAQA